jgi:Kdo2-lipid IVA lauroyltransferase/acyltransferase
LAGWLLRALARLVGLLPWRALAGLGRRVGWLAGSVLRIRRAHVERAMGVAGIGSPARAAGAMYEALGRSALEFLWLAGRDAELSRHVAIDPSSVERWRAAVAGGRGVVIAASHTGNWDLAACAMAREVELLVVTKHLSVASIDGFWQSTRARHGVTLSGAEGALARGREVLRRGGAVAMMIDQAPSSRRYAVAVDFLGRPALADRGPATLAATAGSPMIVAAARRTKSGTHLLEVLRVIEPPPRTLARSWIGQATISAAQALEAFVRAHPDQWLWLHRRWKPPEADRRRAAGPARSPGVDRAARAATLAPPWCKIRSSLPGEASKAG